MGRIFPLTLKERKKIKYLIDQNLSLCQVAVLLGRSKNCIHCEVRRAGGRDRYDPEIEHEKATKRNEHRIQALRISHFNKNTQKEDLNTRISNLEMQLEIIIEQIQGILNDSKH